jgi:hypothetical protein
MLYRQISPSDPETFLGLGDGYKNLSQYNLAL